ncbi:MAG: hypothetical protein HKN22_06340 [Bacteroidia bacterium]|nr:hypothetical protein [Bacteroidia bacterium]
MAKQVPANEQGKLQGGLTSLASITTIIGPIMMTSIFYYFTKADNPIHFPGAAFVLGAILMFISFLITYAVLRKKSTE